MRACKFHAAEALARLVQKVLVDRGLARLAQAEVATFTLQTHTQAHNRRSIGLIQNKVYASLGCRHCAIMLAATSPCIANSDLRSSL
eukprot:2436242-Pleurochrysis_carterae.AAC.2